MGLSGLPAGNGRRGKQGSSSFSHFGGGKSARKVFISTGLKDFLAKVLTSSFTLPPLIRKSKKVLSGGPTDLALFAQVRGAKKPRIFFWPRDGPTDPLSTQ